MEEKFETWAVVELMGHQRIAGLCSEQNVAGSNMLRVDVPENETQPGFTRLLGGSAIYAINPVTEEVAKMIAGRLNNKPIEYYDIQAWANKNRAALQAGYTTEEASIYEQEEENEEDY